MSTRAIRKWLAAHIGLLMMAAAAIWVPIVVVGVRIQKQRRIAAAREEIVRQVAAIRAKGEPMSLAELAPPPVADADNAAIPLAKAFALRRNNDGSSESFVIHVTASRRPGISSG